MRKLLPLLAILASPALAQQPNGTINAPIYATGYISQVGGTNVTTSIPPQPNHPTNLNIYTTDAIFGTWTIKLPNPAFEGQMLTFNCGSSVNIISVTSSDGSTIDSGVPTTCSALGGFGVQFDQRSNIWRILGSTTKNINISPFTPITSQWLRGLDSTGVFSASQPSFQDIANGQITSVPSITVTGQGQTPSLTAKAVLSIQTQNTSAVNPSHLVHFDLLSDGAAGGSPNGGNVTLFVGATGTANSRDMWGINVLNVIRSGMTTGTVQGIENDLDNADGHRGDIWGYAGLGNASYNYTATGNATYRNTGAYAVLAESGTDWTLAKQYNRAFIAYGLVRQCVLCDYAASQTAIESYGRHDYFIDLTNATINQAILKSPNAYLNGVGGIYLGAGANTGALNLYNGVSGHYAIIAAGAAASDYLFTLPTTAGLSAQVLASGGGGGAPMTWTTLVAVATSGSASDLSAGTLAAARGGAGTISGALKGNGSGIVSQAACADLSNGGTACAAATGTSGHTVPFLDDANTWSSAQTFQSYIVATHYLSSGTAPSASSCGGSPSIDGLSTNGAGSVTFGTGGPTSCTVAFSAAYPNNAYCSISPANAAAFATTAYLSAQSATGFIITTAAPASGAKYQFVCLGR